MGNQKSSINAKFSMCVQSSVQSCLIYIFLATLLAKVFRRKDNKQKNLSVLYKINNVNIFIFISVGEGLSIRQSKSSSQNILAFIILYSIIFHNNAISNTDS